MRKAPSGALSRAVDRRAAVLGRHRAAPTILRVLLAGLAIAAATSARAQEPASPGYAVSIYVQQAFPKQTKTNAQIEEINQLFGTDFDTWDDIANLSLGVKLFKRVSPYWYVGVEWDYSRGGIDGRATIDTEAGPARITFKQHYSIYTDLLVAAHFFPCPKCRTFSPFVLGGAGIGYERDKTTLTLRNDYIDDGFRVDNSGTFPVWTLGVGGNLALTKTGNTFLEVGVAYYWGRLKHYVDMEGGLAPVHRTIADNDTTGPNYWVGIGWRF
jgi:hypothetical protein